MEILQLIDALEELVIQSRRLPVGGNLVMDRKRMLDVIDQMRLAVPADIREASQVLESRERVLADAHEAAQETLDRSEADRARRLDDTSIMREAQERSQAMLIDAEARARETIAEADATAAQYFSEAAEQAHRELAEADEYAMAILERLEHQLQAFLESVRMSMESLGEKR